MNLKRLTTTFCTLLLCLAASIIAVGQSKSYDAEKEIAFELNNPTGLVHIPADYNWVRYYQVDVPHAPMVNNMIDIRDSNNYRFFIGVEDLRKLCGKGTGKLPVKATIYRGNRKDPFHITSLIVRFKLNGYVEVKAFGYIFEK